MPFLEMGLIASEKKQTLAEKADHHMLADLAVPMSAEQNIG